MSSFGFHEMQAIQRELQEKYKDKWGGLGPETARSQLLWMMIEAGEMADVIKKEGDEAILHDETARRHFIEEMADVFMYLTDVMLCYGISAEEYSVVHARKHAHNTKRDYAEENRRLFEEKP